MVYIENINDFQKFIQRFSEKIIFPIGIEGRILLDFLYYTNSSNDICCMNNTEQCFVERGGGDEFIHSSIPSIPASCLLHFRDSAIFIVASPQNLHSNIYKGLIEFGCKNIVVIKEELIKKLQNIIQNFASSGQILIQFMNHTTDKIRELEYRIAEQNEIRNLHFKTFANYKNCFQGKKLVIIGTGPSVKFYKPLSNAIHIGLNFAFKIESISLKYLFTMDGASMESNIKKGFKKIQDKIFIGKFLDRLENHWIGYPESYHLFENKVLSFYLGEHYSNQPIYQDIRYHPLIDFGSVAFPAIQFALFTYPSEIYLVGCDTSHSGYFYKSQNPKHDIGNKLMDLFKMKVGYARIKLFVQKYYPDIKITSINPVGLKGLFNDIYTNNFNDNIQESINEI